MRFSLLTIFLAALFCSACSGKPAKNKAIDNFQYRFENAHPNAQALMKEDFYWSPVEESAPFGNDDGWDAAYGFRTWRAVNKTTTPVAYLKNLIAGWQHPVFDLYETDSVKIEQYIQGSKELSEAEIQQQIKLLEEANKNSPGKTNKADENQLREIVVSSSKGMNRIYLAGQDNAIIGTGFAQFVLEGHMDKDMKELIIIAIQRQLKPLLINGYEGNYRDRRRQQLSKMLTVVNEASRM